MNLLYEKDFNESNTKQNPREAAARSENYEFTIMRDLVKKGLTYYQQNPE